MRLQNSHAEKSPQPSPPFVIGTLFLMTTCAPAMSLRSHQTSDKRTWLSSSALSGLYRRVAFHHDPKTETGTRRRKALQATPQDTPDWSVSALTPLFSVSFRHSTVRGYVSAIQVCRGLLCWGSIDKHSSSRVRGIKRLEMSPSWGLFGLVARYIEFSTFFKKWIKNHREATAPANAIELSFHVLNAIGVNKNAIACNPVATVPNVVYLTSANTKFPCE